MGCATSANDQDRIVSYAAGKLGADERLAFEAHLESCAACREEVKVQQAVWAALGEWAAEPVSPGFNRTLYARIDEEAGRGWTAWLRRGWRPALPAAALCAAVLAAVIVTRPVPSPVSPTAQTNVEAVEVEQVEHTLEDLEMLRQLVPPTVPREM